MPGPARRTTTALLLAALAAWLWCVPALAHAGGARQKRASAPRSQTRFTYSREVARPIDRAARRRLTATLGAVNDLVRSLGGVPPAVTLYASRSIDMSSTGALHRQYVEEGWVPTAEGFPLADPVGVPRALRSGDRLVGDGGTVSGRGARAITVHEYSHLVFFGILTARSPRAARLFAEGRRGVLLDRQVAMAETPAARAAAEARLAEHDAARDRREALVSIVAPYDELFADAVAVFHDGAPDAVSRPLGELAGDDIAERDFGRRNTVRSTRAAIAARGNPEHAIAAPIRSLLWRTYQQRLAAGERDPRPALLRALARASVSAVEARLATGRPLRSVASFNRDLRRRLQADPEFAPARQGVSLFAASSETEQLEADADARP